MKQDKLASLSKDTLRAINTFDGRFESLEQILETKKTAFTERKQGESLPA